MLKRVLALLLALIFCLSLPCAALADTPKDTDPPQWQQWGYDSLEECLADWDYTEEDYYDEIAFDVAWELEYSAWKADYLAAHPNYVSKLLAEDADDPLWRRWGYESQQAFEDNLEESYADYLADWELEDLFWDQWYDNWRLRKRVELGGPAEGIGVMWMGEYVQFPDAQPTMVSHRTMVPVRVLMERAGATVDYQDNTVLLKTGDAEISFRAGETTATLTKNGETSTIQMDVAPYVEQQRTYVPLRFFSQALGYDVLWDSYYKTAVILDPEAAIGQVNQNFQTVNRFLAAQKLPDDVGVRQCDVSMNGKLTVFDSMNGNKMATMSGSTEALISADGMDSRSRYNIGEVLDLALALIPGVELDAEDLSTIEQMRRVEMEQIYNAAEDKYYMYAPALTASSRPWIPMGAWTEEEFPSGTMDTVMLHGTSVGALLYAEATEYGGVESYAELMEAAESLADLLGDSRFATVAGGKELRLDLKTMSEDWRQALLDGVDSNAMKDFSIKLRVNDDGSAKLSGNFTVDSGIFGVVCSLEMSVSTGKATATLNCHVRNLLELTITGDSTVQPSSRTLRTAPPAGATVIDKSTQYDYMWNYYDNKG